MKRLLSCLLAILCVLSVLPGAYAAPADRYPGLKTEEDFETESFSLNGRAGGSIYVCEDVAFLPLQQFADLLGIRLSFSYNRESRMAVFRGKGFYLSAKAGKEYVTANDRYVFAPGGIRIIKGLICFPAETLEKVFSIEISRSAKHGGGYVINAEAPELISSGVDFYADNCDENDIFWLSHIISAEAADQPFAGLLGVGNVIMNRLADDEYPDDVYHVIFDTNAGIQFEPVKTGAVYNDASEDAIVAAYMCFDGYNTSGDSMYFIDPRYADDYWFRTELDYRMTIGTHDFYARRAG